MFTKKEMHPIGYYQHHIIGCLVDQYKAKTVLDVGGRGKRAGKFMSATVLDANPETNGISGTALPFKDNAFDVVISVNSIEHVGGRGDQLKCIKEMVRTAKFAVLAIFPVGKQAAKLEKIKKDIGHLHPCVIAGDDFIDEIRSSITALSIKVSNIVTCREHLLGLALTPTKLSRSMYCDMFYKHTLLSFNPNDMFAVLLEIQLK